MTNRWISPGHAAHEAFDIGMKAAALVALCGFGFLYWLEVLSPISALLTVLLWVPVYLLIVASVLSKWLGLSPDVTDLRPVTPSTKGESRQSQR